MMKIYMEKFLGVTDLGYANKKSAQKFMTQIPNADYDTDTWCRRLREVETSLLSVDLVQDTCGMNTSKKALISKKNSISFLTFFVDMDDFEKMRKKIRTEEIEYREGIVEIKVAFLDEKSSK